MEDDDDSNAIIAALMFVKYNEKEQKEYEGEKCQDTSKLWQQGMYDKLNNEESKFKVRHNLEKSEF